MVDETNPPIVTVWRATTAAQNKADIAENATVEVVAKQPEEGDWEVLYEFHVPRDALQPAEKEGRFLVNWVEAKQWPHQVIAR